MQALPHEYRVTAAGDSEGLITLQSQGLTELSSAPPAEFDGPGDQWSPETLLLAAVADCFILSFRAVAAASDFSFNSLTCESTGILDRIERTTRFTEITNHATLTLAADGSEKQALRLLEKAESVCLISNSLNAKLHLETQIISAD